MKVIKTFRADEVVLIRHWWRWYYLRPESDQIEAVGLARVVFRRKRVNHE